MPRRHAPFCDLDERRDHAHFCVSRPIAREAVAKTEADDRIDLTVDLASPIDAAGSSGFVRLVGEPPDVDGRFVIVLNSGSARQVATALLAAADQADELDRDVSAPRPWEIR